MKIDNVGMMVGFVASIITQEMLETPLWFEVIGCAGGTFVGWQLGCLANIIWDYRHVTDPDPELSDAEIAKAFMAEHETLHNQYEKDYRQRKPYIEDTYMDDDIKNV